MTGWTRGLGEGILRAYTDVYGKDLSVIGIARSGNPALAGAVRKAGCALRCISGNLADADDTDRIIRELERCQAELLEECGSSGTSPGACPEQSILINNAAIIGPIETLPTVENSRRFYDEAQSTFALNCIAPALLSGWFLSHCAGSSRNLIINISSGASQGAMNGAGIYSMTKIALNMLGRILVSEQEEPGQSRRSGVKVLSISPGMVETQMQETLRESRKFPNAEYFREAARNGTVRSNVLVGKMIAELDFDRLENGSYHHIQDLIESDGA